MRRRGESGYPAEALRTHNCSIWCISERLAMQFTEAFERLGYSIGAQRQDWSAQNERGVCISLWRKEMGVRDGLLWMDTRVHAGPFDGWKDKPGNHKRIRHLRRALDQFGGLADVVIVSGEPGVSYGTAQPWLAEGARSGTRWRISNLDENTGHFEVRLEKQEQPCSASKPPAAPQRA